MCSQEAKIHKLLRENPYVIKLRGLLSDYSGNVCTVMELGEFDLAQDIFNRGSNRKKFDLSDDPAIKPYDLATLKKYMR